MSINRVSLGINSFEETPEERMSKFDSLPADVRKVFRETPANLTVLNVETFIDASPTVIKHLEKFLYEKMGESTAEVYGEDHPGAYNFKPLRY